LLGGLSKVAAPIGYTKSYNTIIKLNRFVLKNAYINHKNV